MLDPYLTQYIKIKSIKNKLKRPEERQMGCLCLMGTYGVLVWEDDNVLEMNSGDGHTAV